MRLFGLSRRATLLGLVAVLLLGAAGGAYLWKRGALGRIKGKLRALHARLTVDESCLDGPRGVKLCVVSDMARLPPHGPVPREEWLFSARSRTVALDAARGEVVAFQLLLKGKGVEPAARVTLQVSDLSGPGGSVLPADRTVSRYLAHYVWVDPGGYTWGPRSEVLPWPESYPDALVPFRSRCRLDGRAVKQVVRDFPVPPKEAHNQSVWVELYVPLGQTPGPYRGALQLSVDGSKLELPLSLQVHPVTLPSKPTQDAVGELYQPYEVEGVGKKLGSASWRQMSHCYHQLAHRHRMVFIERLEDVAGFGSDSLGREPADWTPYDAAFGPVLSGELFTARHGYSGPGEGVPVTVWRTPWAQGINERLRSPLTEETVKRYEQLARQFAQHLRQRGWTAPYLFAYIFDEVVGGVDTDSDEARWAQKGGEGEAYVRMVHEQMRRVQQAIDRGSGETRIDLLWTSHAQAARWSGKPGLDLAGTVRLWAPTATAADPAFLARRRRAGDRVWFYHSGHPAAGIHAINASGIELRTWGVISARYGLQGQLMWAVNLGSPDAPYAKPSYKNDDDRFGNGTLVYPGRRLTDIGFPSIDEPVPSMRLKAWRRGLQDAELCALARAAGHGDEVDRLLKRLIPRALAQGRGKAAWPMDSAVWNQTRRRLLQLAASR